MIVLLVLGIILLVFGFYANWYTKFFALDKIDEMLHIIKAQTSKSLVQKEVTKDAATKDETIEVSKSSLLAMKKGPLAILLGIVCIILYLII